MRPVWGVVGEAQTCHFLLEDFPRAQEGEARARRTVEAGSRVQGSAARRAKIRALRGLKGNPDGNCRFRTGLGRIRNRCGTAWRRRAAFRGVSLRSSEALQQAEVQVVWQSQHFRKVSCRFQIDR